MGLSEKERIFVVFSVILLIVGFSVLGYLSFQASSSERKVDFKPQRTNENVVRQIDCGDNVCQDGERDSCQSDCTNVILQADDSHKIILDSDTPILRQVFVPVGENVELREIRIKFVDTVHELYTLRLFEETTPDSLLFEGSFYMPEHETERVQTFEEDILNIPLKANVRHIIEIEASESAEGTFLVSQNEGAYPNGTLSIYGVSRDSEGMVVDTMKKWTELDQDLYFTILLWTDDRLPEDE